MDNTKEVWACFEVELDIQLATMIYSMEKVLIILQAWIEKVIDFHLQKMCIITLKKGHGLSHLFLPSTSCPTRDLNVMDVDFVHLKKLTPTEEACCIREGLCFRCWKKWHNTNSCNFTRIQGLPKSNKCLQQVKITDISPPTTSYHYTSHFHVPLCPNLDNEREDPRRDPPDLKDVLWGPWWGSSCYWHLQCH